MRCSTWYFKRPKNKMRTAILFTAFLCGAQLDCTDSIDNRSVICVEAGSRRGNKCFLPQENNAGSRVCGLQNHSLVLQVAKANFFKRGGWDLCNTGLITMGWGPLLYISEQQSSPVFLLPITRWRSIGLERQEVALIPRGNVERETWTREGMPGSDKHAVTLFQPLLSAAVYIIHRSQVSSLIECECWCTI